MLEESLLVTWNLRDYKATSKLRQPELHKSRQHLDVSPSSLSFSYSSEGSSRSMLREIAIRTAIQHYELQCRRRTPQYPQPAGHRWLAQRGLAPWSHRASCSMNGIGTVPVIQ